MDKAKDVTYSKCKCGWQGPVSAMPISEYHQHFENGQVIEWYHCASCKDVLLVEPTGKPSPLAQTSPVA